MALSASTYYSNAIVGNMQAGADVDVGAAHAAPKYPVGQGFTRADGNIFRYAHVGTATNAGNLVGPTTSSGGATYGAAVVVASTAAVVVEGERPITPGSVGSHYVEVTIASIAINKYQGGYLICTEGTGIGHTYRIIGNTASGTPVTGNLRIQLADPIKVALTVNTGLIIVPSMFTDLAATTTSASQVTGVLMATTTSTNLWAWVCTRGVAGCFEDNTAAKVSGTAIAAGQIVVCSNNTAGAYMQWGAQSSQVGATGVVPLVGYVITPASSPSRQGSIYMQLE